MRINPAMCTYLLICNHCDVDMQRKERQLSESGPLDSPHCVHVILRHVVHHRSKMTRRLLWYSPLMACSDGYSNSRCCSVPGWQL